MSKLQLKNISKKYPGTDHYAVENFNLTIEPGEFIVLVGPSGCGKSTTLRMIAGLEEISQGEFLIDGKVVNDMSSKERDIAMVFQSYALYPHMTVKENVGYGLKLRKFNKEEMERRVTKIASDLDLTEYLERKPKALSGGQRQRVALGRAMVRTPKFYLMDEPLSNLDAKLRATTRTEISRMHRNMGVITIYVTHDQVEAMTMADRIVLMSMGEIQQIGTPEKLYKDPINRFVATFIGMPPMNIIKGTFADGYFITDKINVKLSDDDKIKLTDKGYNHKEVYLGVRSSAMKFEDRYAEQFPGAQINVDVINVEFLGDNQNVFFELEDHNLFVATITPNAKVELDTTITLHLDTRKLHFFDIDTEKSIKYDE